MSDEFDKERRVPDDLEESRDEELSRDAYERTVPASLTGFRGLNPLALALGGGLLFAVVLIGIFSFVRHTSGSTTVTAVATPATSAGPAAPGVGENGDATPLFPVDTPFPSRVQRGGGGPKPFFGVPTPIPTPTPIAVATPTRLAQADYSASSRGGGTAPQPPPTMQPNSRMAIEQPQGSGQGSGAGQGAQDQQAAEDLGDRDNQIYIPVYRNGKVVSVVPVDRRISYQRPSSQQQSAATANNGYGGASDATPQPAPNQYQPGSSQFVSSSEDGGGVTDLNTVHAQNQQKFVRDQQKEGDVGYTQPVSQYQLDTTSFIKARLLTKIVSDLPGPVIAQTVEPVYDSGTHSTLVIPEGTKIFGNYDNALVSGQNRLLMAFQRLVFPDGREFVMGGQPGTDAQGAAGFSGDTDAHRGQLYTAAFLLTVLGGAEAAISPQTTILSQTVQSQLSQTAAQQLTQVGNRVINQQLQRPPTLIIRPPYRFTVVVTRDLPLDQYRVR